MPYKVLKDGTTLLKDEGERASLSKTSDEVFMRKSSAVYRAGDIVQDEDIASSVIDDYDNEVGSIRDLIERIADEAEKPEKKSSKKSSTKSSSQSKKSGGQKK